MSFKKLLKEKILKYSLLVIRSLIISTLIVATFSKIPIPKTWAASVSWVGGTDTNWSTAANWSTGIVPTSSDDVLINSNVTVNLGSTTTIKSLVLGNVSGTTTPILNFAYDAITVGALTIDGGNLTTYTGSQITHTAANLGTIVGRIKIILTTGDITIGGNINADNKGYAGGNTNGANGYGTGGGIGWYSAYGTGGAGGAGHATHGQAGSNSAGGIVYQSLRTPTDLGSGGGRGYSYSYGTGAAGAGGGSIYLYTSGNLTISGTVSANGQAGAKYSGGGAGGSIYLHGNDVTISGTVSSGGGASSTSSGAGSGGRILIEYAGTKSQTGTINVSTTTLLGTAYFKDVTHGDITIPVANAIWYSGNLDSWSFRNMYINANVMFKPSTTSTFQITASGSVTLANSTTLSLAGYYTTDSDGVGILMNVTGDITVPSTSKITGNALGYLGGYSTSYPTGFGSGKGIGLANHSYGDVNASGAGHGGSGGAAGARAGGASYGSTSNPVTLGSGGGFGNSYLNPVGIGGNGGSAIKLIVGGTTQIDGALTANGGDATTIAGGGAGGSINIDTGTLAGAGTISANGGTGVVTAYGTGGNGGGGRIAINYTTLNWSGSSFLSSVATVRGANGSGGNNGTVYIVPSISSSSTTNILKDSATITGSIYKIDILGASDTGFLWDDNAELSSPTQISKGASSTNGAITSDLSGLSPLTTYYYKTYATVSGVTSYSAIQSFITLSDNSIPTALGENITGGTNIYAGKQINIQTVYSDADGIANLDKLYLQIKNPSGTDIEYYATASTTDLTGQTPVNISGASYISSITYDIDASNPTSNDTTVTWNITLGWNWTRDTTIQYGVKALDLKPSSGNYSYTTSYYAYENRLTFTGSITAFNSEEEAINSGDWTAPNESLTFSGIKVVYWGTTNIYPSDDSFDVKLVNDETSEWFDNISSGQNISIEATTASNTNANDDYVFSIINIPTGGLDASNSTFNLKTDNTSPSITLSSSTHPNSNTWYNSTSATISWVATDNQSGIYKVWRLLDQQLSTSDSNIMWYGTQDSSSNSFTTTITQDGTWYLHILVMDNKGFTTSQAYKLNIDAQDPQITSITSSSHPLQTKWYSNKTAIITWLTTDSGSGILGTWKLLDQSSTHSIAEVLSNGIQSTANATWTAPELNNGIWYVHLVTKDNAGKATYSKYKLQIDSAIPNLVAVTGNNNNIWQNTDSGPVISWTDPNSLSDDIFYITNDGSTPTSTNYTYTTTSSSYDLPTQKEGETTIKVRGLNGAGTYSDTKSFVIKYDATAPTNISNFTASTSNTSITLTWRNPSTSDFNKVIIVRNNSHVPLTLTDGTKIYDDNLTTYTDSNLTENTTYYYTAFALDKVGNQSSGAVAQTITSTSTTEPTVPTINENTKIIEVQNLSNNAQPNITANNQQTSTTSTGDVHVYSQQTVNIEVPASTITSNTTNLKQVILTVENKAYIMEYDSVRDTYKAAITAPNVKGIYDTTIQAIASDNTSALAITMSLKVDPYGYIYTISNSKETKVANAQVFLYKKVDDQPVLWSDSEGTENPQTTKDNGEYQYFVEAGEYKIVVKANGYTTYETDWFTVETNTIEMNIELKKIPYIMYGAIITGGILTIVTLTLIIRKRAHYKKFQKSQISLT